MAILQTQSLKKHYGRIHAVDGVDLTTADGEMLAVLGPSGSGKSTLMRMVAGLEEPSSGDILIDGRSVVGIHPRHRNVAMVFQSFALYPHMSVRDNIRFPLVSRKVSRAEQRSKLDWVTGILEIDDLLDRRPTRLSGGQSQKVALARALVRDPELFVFDEPLSSLDAQIRSQARAELRSLHDRTQITTLYVTHDQLEALGLADRVAVIHNGVLHQVGTPRALYQDPADLFVAGFIGDPPMNLLKMGDTVLGARPEDLFREGEISEPAAVTLDVEIDQVEFLGAESLAYGIVRGGLPDAGEQPPRVILRFRQEAEHHFQAGERGRFVVPRSRARFFDRKTEQRVAEPKGVGA